MNNSNKHISVLLNSSVDALEIIPDGIYVDATLGRGGHSELLLSKLGPNGRLIGIDQDDEAIKFCQAKFVNDQRVTIVKDNFCNLKKVLTDLKIDFVNGVLMDLGVSSPQLDNSYRGFSYKLEGPLDMRMDQTAELTAAKIVNEYPAGELVRIFRQYGDVKNPKPVVSNIIKHRTLKPIETTLELVDIIKEAFPVRELYKNKHPAKVYFQALRVEVNDELGVLNQAIDEITSCLCPEGRLAIITFQSLEDKLVVKKFKELSKNQLPAEIPLKEVWQEFQIINTRAILPSNEELERNNRAHSSKLRVLKRTDFNKHAE
ncbi:16S rRNA (cytosine(1402)-N(4))-methyltransferase RsmH [Ureaplasma ceti]|uniref:Ribosomal RNA small subunit methyltransferase H n=1 Tax=Ureaplasma ceti TaxID=3119530 RepID=A0ABP9UCF4_9BACT